MAILLLAALAYKTWDWKTDAVARIDSLKQESVIVTRQLNDAKKAHTEAEAARKAMEEQIPRMESEMTERQSEYQQILSLQTDYASYIVEITGALPKGAEYSYIGMNPSRIEVHGQVEVPSDVIIFNRTLEGGTTFSSAVVSSLEPVQNTEERTEFQVEIAR